MTALHRMQLRQPLHSQRVKRRDWVALAACFNRADRVIRDAHAFRKSGLHERHGFAQRAEFSGSHGSTPSDDKGAGFLANPVPVFVENRGLIGVKMLAVSVGLFVPVAPINRFAGWSGLGQPFAGFQISRYFKNLDHLTSHLNLSSMGLTALMNTDYSENIGMASDNSEISRKLQSQIVTKEAA